MNKLSEPVIYVYDMCSKEYGESTFDRAVRWLLGMRYWAHPRPYPSGDGLAYGFTVAAATRKARRKIRRRSLTGHYPLLAAKIGGDDV